MSKAVDALTTMAEISNRQTAHVVELAIAFGAVKMAGRADTVALSYSTTDITEFLKKNRLEVSEQGGMTHITVTKR